MAKRVFLIDTDTASDDAVALIMAFRAHDVEVCGLTIVSGNVPVEQGARNARVAAELCGWEGPIHLGAAGPMKREVFHARYFHGEDGLGDVGFAPKRFEPHPTPAADAIIEYVRRYPELELVTLGPLTNVAIAIGREPELMRRVKRCVVMGGNPCCVGNVTPAAEFNIYCDPEAASIVFRSGINLEMVGWQLSRGEYALNESQIEFILRRIGTDRAAFAIRCNARASEAFFEQTGQRGIALPDPVAMAAAIEPSIVTEASSHRVEIETTSELTRGMTVVDRLDLELGGALVGVWPAESGNLKVVWQLDAARWKALLYSALM
jgi:purine nucleosidase